MCGRIALFTPPAHLARFLDAALAAGLDPDAPPSWNVGPQRTLFAAHEYAGARVLDSYRWGLVPSWAKDPTIGNKLFNARGETIAEKPSFRSAFAKRPCVIPVDGFYEWDHRPGHHRQPYYFTRATKTCCSSPDSTSTGATPTTASGSRPAPSSPRPRART